MGALFQFVESSLPPRFRFVSDGLDQPDRVDG